ncbi:hypothetical protein O3Q51_11150 [Cryomorphaceae bacterium 1068]|nr:hypothetical protein [Cryomorphaceae bacterium 1068]
MKFTKRLRLFLTGFLLGSILVVFFFHDRLSVLTSWLPNNRVLFRIENTLDGATEHAKCQMDCLQVDTVMINYTFKEGDVQFGMSETHADPKVYVVDTRYEDRLVRLSFETADSSAILTEVILPFETVECNCP